MNAVLEIEGLSVDYVAGGRTQRALDGVSLEIAAGETVGVIGESGSGKSTLAFAVARHLAANARIAGGAIRLAGADVLSADSAALRRLRRRVLGMVYQNPATALDPTQRVGRQLIEAVTVTGTPAAKATARALELMEQVRLGDPRALLERFPHQLSGGERQRIVIAMAIAGSPRLLNLDEPTSALDPETAHGILGLIGALRDSLGAAVLYISHDIDTVSRLTDRLLILKAGTAVEAGTARSILQSPRNAYTRLLLASRPTELRHDPAIAAARAARPAAAAPVLSVRNLSVTYRGSGLLAQLGPFGRRPAPALAGATFDIAAGRTTAVVGRSGSGKSTLARALVGLVPFSGTVRLDGRDYTAAAAFDRAYRSAVQIVFQNPDASLNPRHRIGEILGRPLRLRGAPASRLAVADLLEQVRLPTGVAERFPHQLSGGQRQRVSIARALAARPRLIICDEITSALDVSTQAAIVGLLAALQQAHCTAFLFISHDLELVRSFADATIVIDGGRIIDQQQGSP